MIAILAGTVLDYLRFGSIFTQENPMLRAPITRPSRMRFALIAASAAVSLAMSALPASAQVFADVKSGLVDYSKTDGSPRKSCDALAKFKAKEIVEIHAMVVPAAAAARAHCRVTGMLAPEIAFEVSLPDKWNGRF